MATLSATRNAVSYKVTDKAQRQRQTTRRCRCCSSRYARCCVTIDRRPCPPMPDFSLMPLHQLLRVCPPLLQVTSAADARAWQELQHRALVEQNPAAWDALLVRLWPSILFWIYANAPEMTPAVAEILAQRVIGVFKRQHIRPDSHTVELPNHLTLIADLRRTVIQVLTTSANGEP